MILLDTHVWIWWLTASPSLKRTERDALDTAAEAGELGLSAISMWKAQMLYAKRRLELPLPFADWLLRATDAQMLSILPLDSDVIIALDRLPASFHGDPADRLIVSTARVHDLPLATHDTAIRKARVAKLWKA